MKLKRRIASFALMGSIACVSPLQALAATSSEIEAQIESYMADLEASEAKCAELQDEIASRQDEVSELYSEVASLNIEKDIYYESMKTRIAYFYEESQGNNLLSALFSSKNFAEFISRVQFQESIYDYDAARLEEYQALVEDLEAKQAELDAEIEDLGDMVEEEAVLQATLDATIYDKQVELEEVKAEEAAAAAAAAAAKAAEEEAARRASMDAAAYALTSTSSSSGGETASYSSDSSSGAVSSSSSAETASSSSSAGSSYEADTSYSSTESTETVSESSSSSSSSSYASTGGDGVLTKNKGVNYYNGRMETWYTQRILPGEGLNIPGRHLDDRGIVCDGDGYICVASDDYPKGTVLETSLGMAKVYDSGPGSGIVDIYTDW